MSRAKIRAECLDGVAAINSLTGGEAATEWDRLCSQLHSSSAFSARPIEDHYRSRLRLPEKGTERCWKGPREKKNLSARFYQLQSASARQYWTQVKTVYSLRLFQSSESSEKSQSLGEERQYKRVRRDIKKCISSIIFPEKKKKRPKVKKLNNVKWIALPPEGDRKRISWAFRCIGWKLNLISLRYCLFCKSQRKMHQNRNLWIGLAKQTEKWAERLGPARYTERASANIGTWLFGSQMNALWLSFKMANECTRRRYVEQAKRQKVINYSGRSETFRLELVQMLCHFKFDFDAAEKSI